VDRRFGVVLLVSLLLAAAVTASFTFLSQEPKRPGLAVLVLISALGLLTLILYAAVRPGLRKRREVEQLLESRLGFPRHVRDAERVSKKLVFRALCFKKSGLPL
jgi:hypothetical protein